MPSELRSGGRLFDVARTPRRYHRLAFAAVALMVAATASAAGQPVTLTWSPAVNATGYVVLYGTAPGQYSASMDTGNQTTVTFPSPVVNQILYFVVKAYNAAGASPPSNEAAAWIGSVWRTPSMLQIGDFDGDGRADPMVYRGSTGEWYANTSGGGLGHAQWGAPSLGDVPVPADYDGDGKTDFAVYRGTTGEWFLNQSRDGGASFLWGAPGLRDLPVPKDYDGDGRVDVAVFRRLTGEWFIRLSSTGALRHESWGASGDDDMPVPEDYDGNGIADIAVYRRSTGQWLVLFDNRSVQTWSWGAASLADVPVPADYDGDGAADIGVFRLSSGTWIVRLSATSATRTMQWGLAALGDVPVPADYNGDNQADFAVFRASTATWFIAYAGGGSTSLQWGAPSLGDSVAGFQETVVVAVK
jgi:hypothetical protein